MDLIAFGGFILACGATHVMEVVTVWRPMYPLAAAVKVICAAASVTTAVLFAIAAPTLVANMRHFFEMLSTTQQEKEQAMRALLAREKLAAAGLISASISHEIKGPLQTAADLLYLLSGEQGIPENVAENLSLLNAELKRAYSIANNTLSLFNSSSTSEPLVLSELVGSVLDLQRPDLARRGVTLHTRLHAPLAVRAYSGELRQILMNLVQNSAAAIGANGAIHVRVQPRYSLRDAGPTTQPGSAAIFRPARPQPGYSITIADNGPGIDPKNRNRLFTLFFTTKGDKGTGLGLWLVRSMVEKQGGRIRFRSRTGDESSRTGTVFNIWIPLEPAPVATRGDAGLVRDLEGGLELSPQT